MIIVDGVLMPVLIAVKLYYMCLEHHMIITTILQLCKITDWPDFKWLITIIIFYTSS